MHHHTNGHPAAHHHSDDPLETRIFALIRQGRELSELLFEAHRKRAFFKAPVNPPAWKIREEIARIEEEIEICLSEWEARKI